MNISIIEDEVYAFTEHFFQDISEKLEDALALIEENNLTQPRENYTILANYLNSIFNHFSNLDYQIVEPIMIKLYRDMITLDTLYKEYDKKCFSLEEIFTKEFENYSTILTSLNKDATHYSISRNLPKKERELNQKKLNSLEQFKQIYFEVFERIFTEEKKYFLSLILQILNSKIYYLDQLIWLKVPTSKAIITSLNLKRKNLNSKDYIQNRLRVILPYSQEYTYLKKCLRIFK